MNKNKGIIGIGLIIAIVLGIAVVGVGAYFLGKSGSKQEVKIPENNLPNNEGQNQNTTIVDNQNNQVSYSYINSNFHFAVNLPNTVVSNDKSKNNPSIFTFGIGDQSGVNEQARIPNKMVVYVYNDSDLTKINEVKEMGKLLGEENVNINGYQYVKFNFSNESSNVYYYTINSNGFFYKIAVINPIDINNFYLL